MAKQLNVNMSFSADTSKAKAQIQELYKTLEDIQRVGSYSFDSASLRQGQEAAAALKQHLDAAVNTNTGKLDLNKFSQSLSRSGQDLKGLYEKLSQIGPDGQQAFLQLAKSINEADNSTLNLGKKLESLRTTMVNTAKWMLSSGVLHKLQGAMQAAYGYAQDLNKSLNNIRIVTGQNIEQMTEFAERANRAAKALSTTTLDYTNASLIYYQQGLDDKTVQERTNVTVKMANVSRQSAEEVSQQLTAVWNNFDDGIKSLEYYADVMTKLGATTASSSQEIATGLEKFAAVADTVGLSYEYSAAALATVTAQTRQSADTVGTSFRTLFARLESLKLGETLEDGVNLSKYTQALESIGVSVLDANGQLKNMDNILEETAASWGSLNNAQKNAFATTVGGTRQYATLIALLDNWDVMQKNLSTAQGAEGTLQKQADIYAESWEAARNRVKAATEGIYQNLIDDKFFISMTNGLEKFLTGINSVIQGLGGLKGVLLLIGSLVTQHYAKEMPRIINSLAQNFQVLSGAAEKTKQSMIVEKNNILGQIDTSNSKVLEAQVQGLQRVGRMTEQLNEKRKQLSQTEIEAYENKIKQVELLNENAVALARETEELEKQQKVLIQQQAREAGVSTRQVKKYINQKRQDAEFYLSSGESKDSTNYLDQKEKVETLRDLAARDSYWQVPYEKAQQDLDKLIDKYTNYKEIIDQVDELQKIQIQDSINNTNEFTKRIASLSQEYVKLARNATLFTDLSQDITKLDFNTEEGKQELQKIIDKLLELNIITEEEAVKIQTAAQSTQEPLKEVQTVFENLGNTAEQQMSKTGAVLQLANVDIVELEGQGAQAANILERIISSSKLLSPEIETIKMRVLSTSESIANMASAFMQVSMAINAIKNLGNIWSNDDLSTGEKLLQTATALAPAIMTITNLLNKEKLAQLGLSAAKILGINASKSSILAKLSEIGPTISLSTANGTLTLSYLALLAPIAAVAAAIAGLVGIILLIVDAVKQAEAKSPEGLLKATSQAAKDLKENADEAKQAVDSLRSAFDKYDTAIDKLNNCIKGTKEWNEALKEVNDTVVALLNDYPELLGKLQYHMKDGHYVIDNAEEIINDAENKANRLQQDTLFAQNNTSQRSQTNQTNIILEKYTQSNGPVGDEQSWYDTEGNEILETGERVFNNSNALSTLIGRASEISLQSRDAFIEEWAEELHLTSTAAGELYDDLIKLGDGAKTATTSLENSSNLIMSQRLSGENVAVQAYASEKLEEYGKEELNNLDKITAKWSRTGTNVGDKDLDQIWEEFQKTDNKYGNLDSNSMTVDGAGNVLLRYYNSTTGELETVTAEYVKNVVAAERAIAAAIEDASSEQGQLYRELEGEGAVFGAAAIEGQLADYFADKDRNTLRQLNDSIDENGNVSEEFLQTLGLTLDQFNNILDDQGLNLQDIRKYIIDSLNAPITLDSLTSIEELRTRISELNKAFASLKVGDIVDDYSQIPENLRGYFQIMEDGTAKLVGDAERFKDALFLENISGAVGELDTLIEAKNQFRNFGEGAKTGLTEEEKQQQVMYAETIALAATNYEQLAYARQLVQEKTQDSVLTEQTYQKGLIDLATSYETCTEESLAFQKALLSGEKATIASAQAALELSVLSAENAEKYGLDAKEVENYAKRLKSTNKELENNNKAVADLATRNMRLNRGIKSLADNLDDALEGLKNNTKGSLEWGQSADVIKEALADIYDIADGSMLSDNFIASLAEDGETLQKIADGDLDTILSLQKAVAQDIAQQIVLDVNTDAANNALDAFKSALDNLGDLEIGEITDSSFITSLNNLIAATDMTKEQIQSMLGSMGMSANLRMETKTVHHEVPEYETVHEIQNYQPGAQVLTSAGAFTLPPSYTETTYTRQTGMRPVDEQVPYYSIETESGGHSSGGGLTYTGRGSVSASNKGSYSSGSGGGGGSSKAPVQQSTKSRDDVVDRYKEVDDSLKRMSEALNKVGDAQDRVWGANRLKAIENQNDLLKDNIELLKKKREEAEGYYEEDQKALQNAAAALNWDIGFNAQGDVVSYRGSMEDIFAQYHAIEAFWANPDNFSTAEQQDEYKEQYVDPLWEKIDILKDKLAQYDETNQLIKELDEEMLSLQYQMQDNNAEMLNYKLELHLELDERERQIVDNEIAALGDDFFKRAEVFAFMLEKMGEYVKDNGIFNLDEGNYEFLVNNLEEWNNAFQNSEVSQAAYVEGLKSVMDASQSAFDDLISWNQEMSAYYADTLSDMKDELNVFTKQIDRLADRLEHYKKVMSLTGRETDYDAIDAILAGQETIARNQYDIQKRLLDDQKAIYEEQLARMADMDEQAAKAYYEAVVKPQKEYIDELEADAEAALEKVLEFANEKLENLQAKAKKTLELSLSNGLGFDALNQSMTLASKYQDEYLTKTNQIYEMNKLLNSLTQDMNKANNEAARERIKNFAVEIEGLKNQTQLSQTELKIAQARYAQLQAQIALEDARNAKSIVRLQRDNEGNFGYVYTADQDQIQEAEQNLAERTNDLYNLALETTNEYTQKIIQLDQEMTEALAELAAQRTQMTEEEYQKRYYEIVDKYSSIRNSYIESRNAGLYWLERTAAKDITEAWTVAYQDNIASMADWKDQVAEWFAAIEDAYEEWVAASSPLIEDLTSDENALNEAIEGTAEAAAELAEQLLGEDGLVSRSEEILNAVDAQTAAWARQAETIAQLIANYQNLVKSINDLLEAQANASSYEYTASPGTYVSDTSSSDVANDNTSVPGAGSGNGGSGEGLIGNAFAGSGDEKVLDTTQWFKLDEKCHVRHYTDGTVAQETKEEHKFSLNGNFRCSKCGFVKPNISEPGFASGGYTGQWGPEGRLAMLHEKELVLDQADTKNILASVELVRQLTSAIDLRAAASITPIGLQSPWYNSNSQVVEQNVTIHAEFPNATDHTEIQLAFEALNNRALQYTARR